MVIFNLKGLLVGVVVVIIFIAMAVLEFNMGLSFLVPGLIGLYMSSKLSTKGEGFFALPSIFFIPTHVYTVLIVIVGAIFFFDDMSLFDKRPVDLRADMVEYDQAVLDSLDISGNDTIAQGIKDYVTSELIRQYKPENIAYRIVDSEDGERILVLVKYVKISEFDKESRRDILDLIVNYCYGLEYFNNRDLYLAIQDEWSIWVTYTPQAINNSRLSASEHDLYNFYGDSILVNN